MMILMGKVGGPTFEEAEWRWVIEHDLRKRWGGIRRAVVPLPRTWAVRSVLAIKEPVRE